MAKPKQRRFRADGGVAYDSTRYLFDREIGRLVAREKRGGRKPQSLAHTTGDAALDAWLQERQAARPAPRVWEEEAPF